MEPLQGGLQGEKRVKAKAKVKVKEVVASRQFGFGIFDPQSAAKFKS